MKFKLDSRTIEVKDNCIQIELDFAINPINKVTVIRYDDIVEIELKKSKWMWWISGELLSNIILSFSIASFIQNLPKNKLIIKFNSEGKVKKRVVNLTLPNVVAEEILEGIQKAITKYPINSVN